MIVAQKPVRLIQPVLPQKRRPLSRPGRQVPVLIYMDKGRVKHPLQIEFLVQALRHLDDLKIRLRGGADDHLSALSGRHKPGRVPVELDLLTVLPAPVLNQAHGCEDLLPGLMRRQKAQPLCRRKLQIDTHPIRQESRPPDQLQAGSRDRLHMDIPLETILSSQLLQGRADQFHGIIRADKHPRA